MPGTGCNKGFTLVELLLAMAISGFVALISYQGLSVAIDASKSVKTETQRLADIQLALEILTEDISQIIARPVRTELGSVGLIMSGGLSNDALMTFSRDGWSNPAELTRTELARINYQWREGSLIRQRWSIMDRVSLEDGLEEVVLLDGIDDIRIEFYTPFTRLEENDANNDASFSGEWLDWWSSERIGLDYAEPLPLAVRVNFSISGFGRINRVISITSA